MNQKTRRWRMPLKIVLLPLGFVFILLLLGSAQQSRPDIQVTTPITLEAPNRRGDTITVEQGESVTLVATISNQETVPVAAAIDIAFQILRNGEAEPRDLGPTEVTCQTLPDPDDSSRCRLPGLGARGEPNDQLQLKAKLNTASLSPDQYTLFVLADLQNRVAETDETNNSGQGRLIVSPRLPNLTVLAEFVLIPEEPQQGDLLTVEFVIENDRRGADVTVPFNISLAFRPLGEDAFTLLVPPALFCPDCTVAGLPGFNPQLPKDQQQNRKKIQARFTTLLLTPAEYQLRIAVDSGNDVEEANESDNVLTFDFRLGEPPRNLSLSEGRLTPSVPSPESLISLAFAIRNESMAAATGVDLKFSLRQPETGTVFNMRDLPGFACAPAGALEPNKDKCAALTIGANGSLEIRAQFSAANLALGRYELEITVDPPGPETPRGKIAEINEGDNTLLLPFTLVEPGQVVPQTGPELHPTGLSLVPSSPIVQGQKVLVSAIIANSGNQDAGEFLVEFFIRREDVEQPQSFTLFGRQTIAGLRVGKTIEARRILETAGLEPGLYAVKVVVNSLGQAELDRNNNTIIAFLTVLKP